MFLKLVFFLISKTYFLNFIHKKSPKTKKLIFQHRNVQQACFINSFIPYSHFFSMKKKNAKIGFHLWNLIIWWINLLNKTGKGVHFYFFKLLNKNLNKQNKLDTFRFILDRTCMTYYNFVQNDFYFKLKQKHSKTWSWL